MQQFVREAVATADALDEEAFGAVVEEAIEAEGDVAITLEDDAEDDVLDEYPAVFKVQTQDRVKTEEKEYVNDREERNFIKIDRKQ
ncbi:MAG: hypothetical protein WBA24_13220 [Geitlerinemataceae cyanobacterium]